MLFNSIQFLIFFPLLVIIYFLTPHKWRWLLLLGASIYFYMSFTPYYILLLISVVIVDYFMAVLVESSRESGKGNPKLYLIIGVVFPLLILFLYKYFDFFNQTVVDIARVLDLHYSPKILKLILPIGISFYTFQSLSYVIEVYMGNQKAEKNFGMFALYVMFFPQLVAGPIERPQNLLHQFYEKHDFNYQRFADGLKLMAWGFFKKLVIADRAAIIVNEIYGHPHDYTGVHLIVGTIAFSFQVYCDFAGYSDIAIGAAKVIGFDLMENFRRPYLAQSIGELWRRWHISMTTWFRDYLYIPMGGSKVSYWRWQYNLFIMFIVSGLWHGANWTYVVWAGLNAVYIIVSNITKKMRARIVQAVGLLKVPRFYKIMRIIMTFSLFSYAAIFFRANTIKDAFYIATHLFDKTGKFFMVLFTFNFSLLKEFLVVPGKITFWGFSKPAFLPEMIILVLSILGLTIVQIIQEKNNITQILSKKPWYVKWALYYMLLFTVLFLGVFKSQQFIYFRF